MTPEQRIQPFTTGSFLEVKFVRLAYPLEAIHGGQKRARSSRWSASSRRLFRSESGRCSYHRDRPPLARTGRTSQNAEGRLQTC